MDYDTLLHQLNDLRTRYPKVYRTFIEVDREYRNVQADILMRVHSEYASQPLREKAVLKEMEAQHADLIDKHQAAEYEYTLIENESRILYTMSKLLMAKDYSEAKIGKYGE